MPERDSFTVGAGGERPTPPSPLDPFLGAFLGQVGAIGKGFAPLSQTAEVAGRLGWPAPFVETLFVSARARGLVSISFDRGTRNRWQVTPRGQRWLVAVCPAVAAEPMGAANQDDGAVRSVMEGVVGVGRESTSAVVG